MMVQNQPSRGVLRKRCSKNIQQIYRRTPCRSAISIKLQSKFIEMAIWHECTICCIISEHLFLRTALGGGGGGGFLLVLKFINVNWTYIRRSEDVLDVFWKSYVRSICVLFSGDWHDSEYINGIWKIEYILLMQRLKHLNNSGV